jgi:AraC-like DNA-binding protein
MTGHDKQIAMQRAASLILLPSLLSEFGVGLDAVLEGTGVSGDQLRPDVFIPYTSYLAILANAAALTGREDVGLLLGRQQKLAALGPLGRIMRHAATLGDALADFTKFQINNSTGGAVYLMRADRDVILGYGVYDLTDRGSAEMQDMVLAVGCNLISELTNGAITPEEIFLSRSTPKNPIPYRRLANCPVRFEQTQTGVLLSASALAFPLPDADMALHDQGFANLVSVLDGPRAETSRNVRHLLRPMLMMSRGGMEDVAGRLGIHPRAMRRRLQQEGTTFEAIKDEVRYAVARQLLLLGALNITDIALTLDYSSASSFVHAFRRWSGMSPGAWRESRGDA